jgi:heme exporter protein B
MIKAAVTLLRMELRLSLRSGADALMAVAFFIVTVSLFPLGLGPDPNLLQRIAPGIVWVIALLAALLPLDRLFAEDHNDGMLDQWALSPLPLEITVLVKVMAQWLTTAVPILVAAPILAMMLGMEARHLHVLILALAIGTPALCLFGAIGAALSVGARRAGILISLLALPLQIPVLIFGVGAVDAALMDLTPRPHLLLLAASTVFAATVAPFAAAAALRQAVEND